MPCNFPVGTYRLDGSPTVRPCGSCIQCRLGYAKDWAIRCVHEAQMHENNSFITLTYNNENLPENNSVNKIEMQNFMKRLRKEIEPKKIRFFGSGEYGYNPKTGKVYGRPHYHLCLFGFDFPDKEDFRFRRWSKRHNDMLYISPMLQKIWKKGFSTIGEVNINSAGYVARYVTKKITGNPAPDHYGDRMQEFALMSRGQKKDGKGGIGKPWFDKYSSDVYPKDFIVIDGKKHRPPRYYDSLLRKAKPKMYEEIMERRRKKAELERRECSMRQMQKEKYGKLITQPLERELENEINSDVCAL